MKIVVIFTLMFICCLRLQAQNDTIPVPTQAPEEKPSSAPWFVERFRVTAGLFVPINSTKIEVGNAAGTRGTTIDFENDLGFSKSTGTFLADLQWRISRRSRLDLSYYHIDRSSSHQIQREIEFEDHTYPINAEVHSSFNTDIYRLSYGYAFFSKPRYEAGLIVGAHVVRADVGLGTKTSVGNADISDDFGFTAPLPDVGIWGGYVISPKWAVNGEVSFLSVRVDNVQGRIISFNASVMYKVAKKFTLAVGYTGLNFKVDVTKERAQGYFKWGYNGPSLVASFAFGKKKW